MVLPWAVRGTGVGTAAAAADVDGCDATEVWHAQVPVVDVGVVAGCGCCGQGTGGDVGGGAGPHGGPAVWPASQASG